MRIDVVTLFPKMIETVTEYGVTGRALRHGLLQLATWNPRDFTTDNHRTVDDRPYGGGPGMVMKIEPLRRAIAAAKDNGDGNNSLVCCLSPQGKRFDQTLAGTMLDHHRHLILVAGRYEGIDQRLIDREIDMELSIGDYVLSGGEIAALAVIDTLTRLIPGVLGNQDSANQDSFAAGLLEYPQYTRPEVLDDQKVPDILLTGDHQAIERWRMKQALGSTWRRRPDLLEKMTLTEHQQHLLDEYRRDSKQELLNITMLEQGNEQNH